jgi:pimeloyl-ACP methyl ester carboxylesterase
MATVHSIRAIGLGLVVALGCLGVASGQQAGTASAFTIFVKATPIGSEQISLARTAAGWTISGSGRVGPPLDLLVRRLEIRYDADWKPVESIVDITLRGQSQLVRTTISASSAVNQISIDGTRTEKTDPIDPSALLIPNPLIAPYEAVAAKVGALAAGATFPAYIPPSGSVTVTVGESSTEQFQTLGRLITARKTPLTVQSDGGGAPQAIEIWGDERGRLLRFSVPAQGVDALREDIASVSTRRVTSSRANDEQVRIPANGFSLAGTVSKPAAPAARLPAVVLVGGSGPTDRDENVFGIPVFGQLAAALADAGYIVVRYDKRGVGQSGGRPESATLADYADDLRAVVRFMSERKDVDRRRLAVIGHSEGGALALLTGARENRVGAIGLLGAAGTTGAEINLYQVGHALDRAKTPADQKASTIALQKQIQTAVVTGKGWEGIPPELRKQADVPWFQSFLTFDPAVPLRDARQPILIVQGMLDTQVPPENADRLETLARGRRNGGPVEVVKVPGVNHLLVPAKTGELDEYRVLPDRNISPAVIAAIVDWLKKTFPG